MDSPAQLIVAAMAFVGATLAQIVNHAIQGARERRKAKQESLMFVDMMIADCDYAALNMATTIKELVQVPEMPGLFSYQNDGVGIVLIDAASSHYKLNVAVIPSLVNRVKQRVHVANELLKDIKEKAPCTLDSVARFRLIDYFHAVVRLSVVLEAAKRTGTAGWTEGVTREMVLAKWNTVQAYVGIERVTVSDVDSWLAEIDAARAARKLG